MDNVLWNETATLTRDREKPSPDDLPREIVMEGSLRNVIAAVASMNSLSGLAISLPERRVAPFAYDKAEIKTLVTALAKQRDERSADRPDVASIPVRAAPPVDVTPIASPAPSLKDAWVDMKRRRRTMSDA